MLRHATGRLFQSIIVLAVMSFVIYALIGLMPGDPIDLMISADPKITSADAERLRALQGLNLPIWTRYLNWLTAALSGDLGYSRLFARPVPDVLWPALGNTVLLMGLAFVIAALIGLPLGICAATKPYSRTDYAVNLFAFAGISIPAFWLGLLLIIVFSVILGWLPAGGTGALSFGASGASAFWEKARYLVLPVMTLVIAGAGGQTRYARAAMIETLRQDYIRTARAKGLGPGRVVLVHALRNAMIPVVTIMALDFGNLFSGALITETIFAYPGMGKLIFDSIMGNDFNLALVALLFATGVTIGGNILADLAYLWLDPRISLAGNGK